MTGLGAVSHSNYWSDRSNRPIFASLESRMVNSTWKSKLSERSLIVSFFTLRAKVLNLLNRPHLLDLASGPSCEHGYEGKTSVELTIVAYVDISIKVRSPKSGLKEYISSQSVSSAGPRKFVQQAEIFAGLLFLQASIKYRKILASSSGILRMRCMTSRVGQQYGPEDH